MQYFLLSLHVLISVLLIIVVLLQQSKGGGLAGSFGGAGAGEAFFGARGVMTILHKATIVLGTAFMLSSILLIVATSSGGAGGSNLSQQAAEQAAPVPAPITTQPSGDAGLNLPPTDDSSAQDPGANGESQPADDSGTTDETAGDDSESGGKTP